MEGRIAIFIDGGYLEKITLNEFGRARIDLRKLSVEMAAGLPHLRTYYYNCLPYQGQPPLEEEKERFSNRQRFYKALERLDRFIVRLGVLKIRGQESDGTPIYQQKGVDVFLSTDLVLLSSKHLITHAAMLISDADFIPAIKVAQDEGVVIRLFHSSNLGNLHDLWACADERTVIDQAFINRILLDQTP